MKKMPVHACVRAQRNDKGFVTAARLGVDMPARLVRFEEPHVVVMPLVDTATGIMQSTEVLCPGWPAVPV